MYAFSVGTVAAVINAVVAILQFVLPNVLVLVLVAALSDTHTAVTWSVVGRNIQSSNWPLLLQSDTAATKHVHIGTTIITLLRPLALALVAITAIITPLGLYEDIQPNDETQLIPFVRQPDEGPFGLLTPPRSDIGFARSCSDYGGMLPAQCPGTTTVINYSDDGNTFNATIVHDDYDRRIPEDLAKLYQSGLATQSLSASSFFDVEWRWYNKYTRDNIQNHSYLVDSYLPISPVIQDRDIKLIEGLIVDSEKGGIGFRDHTVPSGNEVPFGAKWEEDILFFLPETACVNTNVSIEVEVLSEIDTDFVGGPTQYLVDRGGFAQIDKHNPWGDGWYGNTQKDPKLIARAYRGAWGTNVLNMFYFGVSEPHTNLSVINSYNGRKFAVNNTLYSYTAQAAGLMSLKTLSLDSTTTGLVDVPLEPSTYANGSLVTNETYYSGSSGDSSWPNPYGINTGNYTVANEGCTAFASGDWVNMTNIQVKCGLVLGPASKIGGSKNMLVEPGSKWTRPVQMCASATKATIRTVQFAFNQTQGSGLEALTVRSITDKAYESSDDLPIWGIETPNMTLSQVTPFWGLISPEMRTSVNLSTAQADHVYIPASSPSIWGNILSVDGGSDYMPGTEGPAVIWNSAYAVSDSMSGLQDLSGSTSLALASLWRNMSATTSGTASIMNLIWTDLAANALIGTRGWLSGDDALPPNLQSSLRKRDGRPTNSGTRRVPVHVYQRVVRYRWVYGIPAAVSLLVAAAICFAALIAVASGRGSISRIRHYLNRFSAGRLLVALKVGVHDYDSSSKQWLAVDGSRRLSLVGSEYESVPEAE